MDWLVINKGAEELRVRQPWCQLELPDLCCGQLEVHRKAFLAR